MRKKMKKRRKKDKPISIFPGARKKGKRRTTAVDKVTFLLGLNRLQGLLLQQLRKEI
jgi:hypothetical protein